MTSKKVEVISDRLAAPTFNLLPSAPAAIPVPGYQPDPYSAPLSRGEVGPLAGLNRIADLEARLHSLRYE